ncbi:RraA family protein [Sporomusa sp.]|uniref:RraA family protein n=1 Tax=Sporomusa sp. TaxID=2078658 RepID=UPI002D0400B7|nr:RraA family protein [Sporomusa sp.]HWR09988.1 RraA family protein [Sporomusa sp.]
MQTTIDGFGLLPTTCISDAMQGLNNFDTAVKPLKAEDRICGQAITVKMPAGDNMMVLKAIKEARPGDILVIDAANYSYRAVAGDFVIGLAQVLGLGGVVAYGTIRDVQSIKAMNFPVFCTGTTVACSQKIGAGEVNVPIACGNATVHPGDIIIGDADGVVAVPQSEASIILAAARKKLQQDEARASCVLVDAQSAMNYLNSLSK